MDYERARKDRWFAALYLGYAALTAYLILKSNPHLYSHRELRRELIGSQRETLKPLVLDPGGPNESPLEPIFAWRESPGRTAVNLSGTHDLEFFIDKKIDLESNGAPPIVSDELGFYLSGVGPWVRAIDNSGKTRWMYVFKGEGVRSLPPLITKDYVFVASTDGTLVRLGRVDGRLHWWIRLAEQIVAAPEAFQGSLILLGRATEAEDARLNAEAKVNNVKGKKAQPARAERLIFADMKSGQVTDYSDSFPIKGQVSTSLDEALGLLLITFDNRLQAVDLESKKLAWSQTLPDPIKGPAVITGSRAFVALISGKVQSWEASKKTGKFEWEVDIGKTPAHSPVWLPSFERLAISTTDGYVHLVDSKKAESLWRVAVDNLGSSQEISGYRLGGRLAEQLGLKWEKKGLTLWAPCSGTRICIYNPDKGQLLGRVALPGPLLDRLHFKDGVLYVFTRLLGSGTKKAQANNSAGLAGTTENSLSGLVLSSFLDTKAMKRKNAEEKSTPAPKPE